MNPRQLAVIAPKFETELRAELKSLGIPVLYSTETTLWLGQDEVEPAWAQCVWRKIQALPIESISTAQKQLQQIAPRWSYYGDLAHRRGALIAAGLNLSFDPARWSFPQQDSLLKNPAAFTLAESGLILYSLDVKRPNASGSLSFVENKEEPPSRAYLKLWEALTVLKDHPKPGDQVVDLGACPGSWTWVLAQLGAHVLSIDRSELTLKSDFARVEFQRGDAFAFLPSTINRPHRIDWIFSDVICYPEKLFEYLKTWIHSGLCQKFVCTIKFAGPPDYNILKDFRKLPNSRILHLTHNKNEVTWISHPLFAT